MVRSTEVVYGRVALPAKESVIAEGVLPKALHFSSASTRLRTNALAYQLDQTTTRMRKSESPTHSSRAKAGYPAQSPPFERCSRRETRMRTARDVSESMGKSLGMPRCCFNLCRSSAKIHFQDLGIASGLPRPLRRPKPLAAIPTVQCTARRGRCR